MGLPRAAICFELLLTVLATPIPKKYTELSQPGAFLSSFPILPLPVPVHILPVETFLFSQLAWMPLWTQSGRFQAGYHFY